MVQTLVQFEHAVASWYLTFFALIAATSLAAISNALPVVDISSLESVEDSLINPVAPVDSLQQQAATIAALAALRERLSARPLDALFLLNSARPMSAANSLQASTSQRNSSPLAAWKPNGWLPFKRNDLIPPTKTAIWQTLRQLMMDNDSQSATRSASSSGSMRTTSPTANRQYPSWLSQSAAMPSSKALHKIPPLVMLRALSAQNAIAAGNNDEEQQQQQRSRPWSQNDTINHINAINNYFKSGHAFADPSSYLSPSASRTVASFLSPANSDVVVNNNNNSSVAGSENTSDSANVAAEPEFKPVTKHIPTSSRIWRAGGWPWL